MVCTVRFGGQEKGSFVRWGASMWIEEERVAGIFEDPSCGSDCGGTMREGSALVSSCAEH